MSSLDDSSALSQRKPSKPEILARDIGPIGAKIRPPAVMEEVRAGLGRPAGADAPLEGLPTDRQALRNAMADLAGGSHPELLQRMSAAMQLSPAQLQQTAAVLQAAAQGQPVSLDSLPPELVRRAAELRRSGVVANDHLLQSMSVMVAPGSTTAAAAPHADGRECGLLDEEEGQHWLTLYRGAYLKHADVYLGPAFTATAALLLWSGTMSFWVALWLLPLLFALAVKVLLVEGESCVPATSWGISCCVCRLSLLSSAAPCLPLLCIPACAPGVCRAPAFHDSTPLPGLVLVLLQRRAWR